MPTRKLEVEIVGDSKSLERAFSRSSKSADKFSKSLKGSSGVAQGAGFGTAAAFARVPGPAAAAAVAIGLAAKFSLDATAAASDLNEQLSKSRAIFGSSSQAIEDWSRTTASSIGVARSQALEATGTFGNLFNSVGITGTKAVDMSKALVQLAADLASFNNATPVETLDAIRSGLVGEAEPLRRFGVLLSEVRVQQVAMAETGKKTAASLTQQEKATARYSIILGDTKKAQGDFERTSDQLANQQRILRARLADTRAELGTKLLPAMLKVTEAAVAMVDAFNGAEASVESLGSVDFRQKFADVFGIDELRRVMGELGPELAEIQAQFIRDIETIPTSLKPPGSGKIPAFGEPGFVPGKAPPVPLGPSVEQRNRIFDSDIARALDRSSDGTLQQQITKLAAVSAIITKRIAITKDITRKLNLEDQLVAIRRQRQSITQQISSELEQRIAEAKASRIEAQAKELERIQARQFRALGLGADGGDRVPGVANLRKQLESLTARLGSSGLNLSSKLESQLAGVRKVLSGEFGKATEESRAKIAELFATIRGEFDKQGKGPLTKTSGLNTNKILAGLGLSTQEASELQGRLSSFNSAGLSLAGARGGNTGSFVGGRAPIVVQSNVTVQLDGHTVGKSVTRSQQKRKKRNPTQRRGPNRGS